MEGYVAEMAKVNIWREREREPALQSDVCLPPRTRKKKKKKVEGYVAEMAKVNIWGKEKLLRWL